MSETFILRIELKKQKKNGKFLKDYDISWVH